MDHQFTADDRELIRQGIRQRYAKVAASPEGNFRYPTGRAWLEGQRYDPQIIKALPEDVLGCVRKPRLLISSVSPRWNLGTRNSQKTWVPAFFGMTEHLSLKGVAEFAYTP